MAEAEVLLESPLSVMSELPKFWVYKRIPFHGGATVRIGVSRILV